MGGDSVVYLYGHDGSTSLTTGLLSEESSSGWVWHLGDGLGSVRQQADDSGYVTLAEGYPPLFVSMRDERSDVIDLTWTAFGWPLQFDRCHSFQYNGCDFCSLVAQ
jgi:hypothetical protein